MTHNILVSLRPVLALLAVAVLIYIRVLYVKRRSKGSGKG